MHNSPRQSLLSRSLKSLNQVSMGRYDRPNALDIIKILVDNGANVNGDQEKVDSALIEAVRMQDVEIVKFLLEHGANGKHKGIQGLTALHVLLMDHPHTHDCKCYVVCLFLTCMFTLSWLPINTCESTNSNLK